MPGFPGRCTRFCPIRWTAVAGVEGESTAMLEQMEAALAVPAEAPRRSRGQFLRRLLARPLTLAGAIIVLIFVVMAVIGPLITPRSPDAIIYTAVLSPPSAAFPFGTD